MKFANTGALPAPIRNALPDAAQTIYLKAFNASAGSGANDAKASGDAWAAVKKAGYKKSGGVWSKPSKPKAASGSGSMSKATVGVGSFVSWQGGKATGKVVSVHKDGVVPNLKGTNKITGTKDAPAARIQVYANGKPTDVFVGHKLASLTAKASDTMSKASKSGGHKPTGAMVAAAKKAKAWKADGKGGLTDRGVRMMNSIISGSLTDQDVVDGFAFLSRALKGEKGSGYASSEDGYPNKKRVSIEAWGGEGALKAFFEPKRNKVSKAAAVDDREVAHGVISKLDADEMRAFGWAQVSISKGATDPLFDLHDDSIHIDELAHGAYKYVRNSGVAGVMHARVSKSDGDGDEPVEAGRLIESMVFTPEKIAKLGLPSDFQQGWWVGFDVSPSVWPSVKNGTLPMFSVHGAGMRKAAE